MLSGLILIGRGLDQKYREKERKKNIYRESLRNQRLLRFIKIEGIRKVHYMVLNVRRKTD